VDFSALYTDTEEEKKIRGEIRKQMRLISKAWDCVFEKIS
jgi:hypothetical protein